MYGLTSSITAGCSRATKQPCSFAQAATSIQTSGDAPEISLENARLTLRRASNLLSFADLRCCSEITVTGCIIGAQNGDYVYRGKTGPIHLR
jgi:hypothetical protein